ncbi:MAG TPA: SDR family oxidoreductase [Chloroflexota bacterium]|jgi:NAD(P)-dependent dehydrogenase (short-subunit alcohol dehydrogenase family)
MPMELELEGKVAVVTGSSDGLGRAVAERLSAEGVGVAICARRDGHLREAAAAIETQTGHPVLAVPMDLSAPDAPPRLIAATVERFGRLDILVNNAGTSAGGKFESLSDELWAQDFELKLFGAVRCAREAIPHMRRQGGGRIVNILNTGAKVARAGSLPTAAARAAGLAVTKALSQEYAAENVLVNGVCIGVVRSMQWERLRQRESPELDEEEFYRRFAQQRQVPVGRVAHASELADLVAFLVSARASYITGVAINFDGGYTPVP